MLFGEARHSMDAKNRLFIPATQRESLGAPFMAVRSIRGNCIKLFSMEQWEEYIKPLRALPRKVSEETFRYLYRSAAQLTPDAQGRVIVPANLCTLAELQKNVVVVGVGNHAEIWSEENWNAFSEQFSDEAAAEMFSALGF